MASRERRLGRQYAAQQYGEHFFIFVSPQSNQIGFIICVLCVSPVSSPVWCVFSAHGFAINHAQLIIVNLNNLMEEKTKEKLKMLTFPASTFMHMGSLCSLAPAAPFRQRSRVHRAECEAIGRDIFTSMGTAGRRIRSEQESEDILFHISRAALRGPFCGSFLSSD